MENKEDFIVLGIDPGYDRLGLAVVKKSSSKKEELVFSECFLTDKKLPHEERLSLLRKEVDKIIKQHKPDYVSMESLFFSTNKKTAIKVSESRGVISECVASNNIPLFEIPPNTIKLSVTGDGRADKASVIKMVPFIIPSAKSIKIDDEMDAVACAIAFISMKNTLIHTKNF